jgi:hypothetical protein
MIVYEDLDQVLKGNPLDTVGTFDALGIHIRNELDRRNEISEKKEYIDPIRGKLP